ncbi:MAG TPA: hypothetical protein DEA96_11990 [Leptospiraceae bacterium]|nr:hypothetical protein [Spirochaetaceae bacterium]HBS05680.1 hypothetical protein [Leptospiraceae bacterium]|tara:strand:- start:15745 stop:18681 length:2937 start_codon:yes stop_codon:yes gene_type:complete
MLAYGEREGLPDEIERDETTGFPLISQADGILQLILAYLELPYSVTEHGCGKKASLIIDYLLKLGIPAYGLARGMALEPDMSPRAMVETDYRNRSQALVAANPLHSLCDLNDERLRSMLLETCSQVDATEGVIQTGPYILRHDPEVQFVQARSHIYPILWFWDPDEVKAHRLVIDPSLDRTRLFPPAEVRRLLHCSEALMFQAPLLGYFRLDVFSLTSRQSESLKSIFDAGEFHSNLEALNDRIEDLSQDEHARLIRSMNGAQEGSLGDPAAWTYANNLQGWERSQDEEQYRNTGRGEPLRFQRRRLIRSREGRQGDAPARRAELRDTVDNAEILRICADDAAWSARALAPLADVTMTTVYFNSLLRLNEALENNQDLQSFITDPKKLHEMRGLGVRLRRRVDWLAEASMSPEGEIDARALSAPYFEAALETIRQMNAAGLHVCIDRVGNLHGLLVKDEEAYEIRNSAMKPEFLAQSIHHVSHIDSVKNAGRFDGRLGVTGGIETAHIFSDLHKYFSRTILSTNCDVRTHVSAFLGEEMTFTGEGVSMPGSSAVAGNARPEAIHKMRNHEGQVFRDRFLEFLQWISKKQMDGQVVLLNQFPEQGSDDDLIQACFDPVHFFSRHSFERHIEQGPVLDRLKVPMALVSHIMGIHQEDFHFTGEQAEAAALDFNRRLRNLSLEESFQGLRITVGITGGESDFVCHEDGRAMRWTLDGELNHAGATAVEDRKDPGVAAARLAEEFYRLIREEEKEFPGVKGITGNVRFYPGINRNVIPGSVSLTLAVKGDLPDDEYDSLARELHGFAVGTLGKKVPAGGEGVRLSRMEQMSFVNVYGRAVASIDLRTAEKEMSHEFRRQMESIIDAVEKQFDVKIQASVQQQVDPYGLARSGQVLLMERSYGGSHNPNEAELQTDLTRGTLLQFQTVHDLFAEGKLSEGFNLYRFTESRIPETYRDKLSRFISGALHDTCNIAAAASRASDQ